MSLQIYGTIFLICSNGQSFRQERCQCTFCLNEFNPRAQIFWVLGEQITPDFEWKNRVQCNVSKFEASQYSQFSHFPGRECRLRCAGKHVLILCPRALLRLDTVPCPSWLMWCFYLQGKTLSQPGSCCFSVSWQELKRSSSSFLDWDPVFWVSSLLYSSALGLCWENSPALSSLPDARMDSGA